MFENDKQRLVSALNLIDWILDMVDDVNFCDED